MLGIALRLLRELWPLVVVLALVVAGFSAVAYHQGTVRKLEAQVAGLEASLELAQAAHHKALEVLSDCDANTAVLEAMAEDYRTRLEGALARPPETVTRYRDRVVRVPQEVTSEECPEAVLQAVRVLADAMREASNGPVE